MAAPTKRPLPGSNTPITTSLPKPRRPENRHSETSPLLGTSAAAKHIPGWGTLVHQLDSEQMLDDTTSERGQTDEADKDQTRDRDTQSRPRTDSPFLDMESGRASPMGDSFGECRAASPLRPENRSCGDMIFLTSRLGTAAPKTHKSLPARVKQRTKYYVPVNISLRSRMPSIAASNTTLYRLHHGFQSMNGRHSVGTLRRA